MADASCARPTRLYPDGRTGTVAGSLAHRAVGEPPCDPCRIAHNDRNRQKYATEKPWQRAARQAGNAAASERYREAAHGRAREVKKRYIARNRAIIQAAKSKPCHDCGVQYPYYVMQFDHLGDKHFNIGNIGPTASVARLLAEIAKCDVVCANCHFERTYRRAIKPTDQEVEDDCSATRPVPLLGEHQAS